MVVVRRIDRQKESQVDAISTLQGVDRLDVHRPDEVLRSSEETRCIYPDKTSVGVETENRSNRDWKRFHHVENGSRMVSSRCTK